MILHFNMIRLAAGSEYAIYSARNALALDTRLLNRSRTVFKFKRAVLQFRLGSLVGEFRSAKVFISLLFAAKTCWRW